MKIGIVGKSRYIDADKLIEHLNAKSKTDYEMGLYNHGALTEAFIRFVERQPTADVVEVRHGAWYHGTENGAVYAKCSACGRKMNYSCYGYAYCALCGAKMDGERREE